jgi:protein-S-isoprenylcysteine O-methyltransferase Ste14
MILFWSGKNNYDTNYFLGLTQWRDYKQGQPARKLPFRCAGALQYIRHPWYSGGIVFLWALGPITDVSLISKVILSGYLVVGSFLEERKLTTELGAVYSNYCRHVPMLIPWRGKVHFSIEKDT